MRIYQKIHIRSGETKNNMVDKPSFESQIEVIKKEIDKRKAKWTLTTVDFDDVRQKIMIHVFKKYYQFEPKKGEFTHWLNA